MRRWMPAAAVLLALPLGACGGSGSPGDEAPSVSRDCTDVTSDASFSVELVDYAFHPPCLIASANYTINEYLDARYDRFHPLKQDRPGAQGRLEPRLVALQYLGLTAVGDTPAEADRRYREACRIVLAEAEQALVEPPLPV